MIAMTAIVSRGVPQHERELKVTTSAKRMGEGQGLGEPGEDPSCQESGRSGALGERRGGQGSHQHRGDGWVRERRPVAPSPTQAEVRPEPARITSMTAQGRYALLPSDST